MHRNPIPKLFYDKDSRNGPRQGRQTQSWDTFTPSVQNTSIPGIRNAEVHDAEFHLLFNVLTTAYNHCELNPLKLLAHL
jgi:hypothetical protein